MKIKSDFYIIPLIIILILLGSFYSFVLSYLNPQVKERFTFSLFILIVAIERLWETFYSTRERRRHRIYGDWTLPVVSILYIALGVIKITEFFYIKREVSVLLVLFTTLLFCYAFALRWLGIKALGRQWTVHAVGAQKVSKVRLLRIGPYKYIRHPIYLGVILELISFSLIFNTYYSFIFCLIFNVPMQIIRGLLEEKTSIRKFGELYLRYKKETPTFIPKIIRRQRVR